ncbi:claudin-4-like [Colossoma macropomum]|uniref:claudin-4-like n=1 Tax=Colossoma macropomum TaxID=42526 RepID=UPI001864B1C3|nr:claudin-4-like [Colossoma macropomum]
MSRGKEIVAIALALIGCIIAVVACVLPMWKVSVVSKGHLSTVQIIWEGLWMSCVMQITGHMQCTAYDSMEALPSDLQLARDMIVIAIITALLPLTLSFMGAKCTNCIKDRGFKAKVMIISGVMFIIAGCLVLIPVHMTRNTTIQFSVHTELGASLYFGIGAAALLIIGGLLLCCTCPSQERR